MNFPFFFLAHENGLYEDTCLIKEAAAGSWPQLFQNQAEDSEDLPGSTCEELSLPRPLLH